MKININQEIIYTEKVYKLIRTVGRPFVMAKFKPLFLNLENIPKEGPIIFASNHRQTLDPFFIISASNIPIHWAALKRFFTADDSIFNNSKNPFLCKFTAVLFKGIGAVPIERGKLNISSIKKMSEYLKNGRCVGIFPEGTTNKKPEEQDLLKIHTEFLHLAKKNDAWVLPISTVWAPKQSNVKNKIVINFREPFKVGDMSIDEATDKFVKLVQSGVDENKKIFTNLQEIKDIVTNSNQEKTLNLVIKNKRK